MWMGLRKFFWPDVTPSFDIHSEFDPNYGFSEPRQKKGNDFLYYFGI